MSRRRRGKVGVEVKPVPVPVPLVNAQVSGELVAALGGSREEIEIAQKGMALGLLAEVVIYGLDADGHPRDMATVVVEGDGSGEVALDLDGGQRSAIDALDAGLARSVAFKADRMRRRGLKPDVRYVLRKDIRDEPSRLTAARTELGVGPSADPTWVPGSEPREVLRVRPGKHKGLSIGFWESFPKR